MMAGFSNDEQDSNEEEEMIVEEEGGIRVGDIYIPPPPPPACTFDSKGPRLIISAITNDNFKSYVGKHVLGPFTKSFNCIIGPNGSGKSNVIDSVLFVFGHRAQKIRSKKVGTLIHNSEQHRNVESCMVGIHFKRIIDLPNGNYEDVPGSEFVISRTAFRDNSSYYCINSRRCQFKDVGLKLRSEGIDLDHNRFLILQGEVEQIAMMKPKALNEHDAGMLEYLEDIIGSIRFKVPLEKLSAKLDELNEQWAEKVNRVKAVQKEKDELEGVKKEAIEYLMLENERTKKKNIMYCYYIYETKLKEDEWKEKKEKADEMMKNLQSTCKEVDSKQKAIEKTMNAMNEEGKKLTRLLDDMKEKFSRCEQDDVRCREEIRHSLSKEKKLQQNMIQEKNQLQELETKPSENENLIKKLKEKRSELEKNQKKEEEALSKVMASLHLETKGLQEEKDLNENQLMGLQKTVDEAKSKMNLIQSELDIYVSSEQMEKARFQEMTKNYDYVKRTLQERIQGVTELEKKIPNCLKQYEADKNELSKIIADEQSISEKLHSKRIKMEEARSSLQASRSQSKVLNALMQQKTSGNIQGIIGRLGDLGAINEKYDIAISTACGALDHIVTDTIDTAQECVDYLKRNNVGVATFIGLDKMDKWKPYMQKQIKTPENVPRLFDLIRVNDEKIRPAFYFALRDTLVAEDLDQATRVAFQGSTRYRVVSLQGHLIEQSGTMSGGGTKVSKGRMGNTIVVNEFNPQQVEKMASEVELISQQATAFKIQKIKLEEQVEAQSQELDKMKHTLEKYKMDVEALQKQEKTQGAEIIEQEIRVKEAAPDKKKVKELQSSLTTSKKAYENAINEASKVETEVQRIHNKIMEITGSKMKNAQKKLDDVNNKIDEVDKSITKADVAIKTAHRNMKKVATKIKNIETEIKENSEKLTKITEEQKKIESEGMKLGGKMKELEAKFEEQEQKKAEATEQYKVLQTENNAVSSRKLDMKHELEQINGQLQDLRAKINHWNKELKKLSLQEVDGQEQEQLIAPTDEELKNVNLKNVHFEITVAEGKLTQMQPNMAAIAEYKKKEQQYLERVKELEIITKERDGKRQLNDNLRKQRLADFMEGFNIITSKLKETYQMITLGGDAELELVDSTDPFAEGIVFSVRPPKKSWKNISNLSGGEKTLSSLALVFALHYYKPTPFYFMDEIDAALDFKNVSIIANYVKERTKNAQFIIISLRDNMFELADRLVGIYKTYNCTKSVSIDPKTLAFPPS